MSESLPAQPTSYQIVFDKRLINLVTAEKPETSHLSDVKDNDSNFFISQWGRESNDVYRPCGPNVASLNPGTYVFADDERGIFVRQLHIQSDHLIELDDTNSRRVLDGIRRFWRSRAAFDKYELVYKRGVLLHGPAGGGKTALVTTLANDLVSLGGLVFVVGNVLALSIGLPMLRRIEPDRPLILIFEDIDEMLRDQSERQILSILDGELQTANVVSIATTNYPENLGARIANRPSRFDERILVGMPSPASRLKYLQHITRFEDVDAATIARWVEDTNTMSIAHLRELFIATVCLGQPYDDVIERLRSMQIRPKAINEFVRGQIGIGLHTGNK